MCQDKESKPGKAHRAVCAHETVMTDFHKPARQNVLEEATNELHDINRHLTQSVTILLAIRKHHRAICDIDDPGIGESHPEDIGGKVFQHSSTIAYRLNIDIPLHLPDSRVDFSKEPAHLILKFGSEDV